MDSIFLRTEKNLGHYEMHVIGVYQCIPSMKSIIWKLYWLKVFYQMIFLMVHRFLFWLEINSNVFGYKDL